MTISQPRGLALQAMTRVPREVPHAVEQVIEECEREADQQDPDERVCEEGLCGLVGGAAACSGDQPVNEQQQSDRRAHPW